MEKRTIRDVDVAGRRVLVRVDFNVPLDEQGRVTDDRRIRESLPTVRYLLDRGASVVLMSHLGRPGGRVVESLRMVPVGERLAQLLARPVQVLPDCLAVGSDTDSIRVCLTPQSAQKVADALECLLPTPRISDEIHRQADLKVQPDPLTHERESIATMIRHSRILDARTRRAAPDTLIAGGKKDVVITNRLLERSGRVAIYGWHHPDGRPIQPLTTVHKDRYVDYSHGIRLVRRAMKVDGRDADLADVLQDPVLFALVSDEGPLKVIRY